jgi:dTDP-glucose 4,6-dehydratase
MRSEAWTLTADLDTLLDQCRETFQDLRGARLFITGGTGFIGSWLLESLRHADQQLKLGITATVLTRDPEAFKRKSPHLGQYTGFEFIAGDVCDFASPAGAFSHVIHAATEASAALNRDDPRRMFDVNVQGTRRVLDFAVEKNAGRVLFLSSGAVYGPQPWNIERVAETCASAPACTQPQFAYAEGKRAAEMLCAIYARQFGLTIATARIFALLGPYLPLGIHFAAGNFILNAIEERPVIVQGNGLPCRSYLYALDLTSWLWHMLVRAAPGAVYNVGSEESISIRDLAQRTSALLGDGTFEVLDAPDGGWNLGRYVPDTALIRRELGVQQTVPLDQAILRTARWNGWKGKSAA